MVDLTTINLRFFNLLALQVALIAAAVSITGRSQNQHASILGTDRVIFEKDKLFSNDSATIRTAESICHLWHR